MRAWQVLGTVGACAVGVACARTPRKSPEGDPSSVPTPASVSAKVAPRPPVVPPPPSFYATLDHGLDRAATNAECESCHQDAAVEWRASLHRQAYRDPSFIEAFALEPTAFCRNCHAPELDPKVPLLTKDRPTELVGFAADDGIACVTCHLPKAGTAGVLTAAMPKEHRPVAPRAAADDVKCGGCHQFTFPDSLVRNKTEWMQSTLLEHARSTTAEKACSSCHMPRVDGHLSHRFAASRDDAMIARAARVTAAREGEVLVLTLKLGDIGHAFPTGDLLRRLAITASSGDVAKPIAKRVVFLARHFGEEQQLPGIVVRIVKVDDRLGFVGPESRVLRITLPGSNSETMRWRVAYQRVQNLGAGEADAKVGGEVVVAEGAL